MAVSMATVNLKNLVARLEPEVRRALETAAGDAMSRGHHDVEIEHWFRALLSERNADLGRVIDGMQLDRSRLDEDLEYRINGFRTGNDRQPGLSSALVNLAENAWLVASVNNNRQRIHAIDLLLAELDLEARKVGNDTLSGELEKISLESLKKMAAAPAAAAGGENRGEAAPAAGPEAGGSPRTVYHQSHGSGQSR